MTGSFVFKCLLAVAVGLALAVFQYHNQGKSLGRTLRILLISLRAALVALLLLLLLNPYVSYHSHDTEKPILAVVVDASASVQRLGGVASSVKWVNKIKEDADLQDKFQLQWYQVDSALTEGVPTRFTAAQSRLDLIGPYMKNQWHHRAYATVVLTDANQTAGPSWLYGFQPRHAVYPVAIADTTRPFDLSIAQVQLNRFAFLHNQYPAEVTIGYQGNQAVKAQLVVLAQGKPVAKKNISIQAGQASLTSTLLLPANAKGLQTLSFVIQSPVAERNRDNNRKWAAVEVVDVPSRVALVSSFAHPDLGALQRALSRHQHRQVDVLRPQEIRADVRYAAQIWYQPSAAFQALCTQVKKQNTPLWIYTGSHTDFAWLQQQFGDFQWQMSRQTEYYQAVLDSSFTGFNDAGLPLEQMPALAHPFGIIKAQRQIQGIWGSQLKGQKNNYPLLSEVKHVQPKRLYLMGEGLWKWRSADYLKAGQFDAFDQWAQKMVQYLCADPVQQPLVVDHEQVYESGQPIAISAQFFNANHEPDPDAQLEVQLLSGRRSKKAMMLRSHQRYTASFSGLPSGTYKLLVTEKRSGTRYQGQFLLTAFQAEQQASGVRWDDMLQLATQTNGQAFTAQAFDAFKKQLMADTSLQPVLRDNAHFASLLDWTWWLLIAILLLSVEWFLRKYHGLL